MRTCTKRRKQEQEEVGTNRLNGTISSRFSCTFANTSSLFAGCTTTLSVHTFATSISTSTTTHRGGGMATRSRMPGKAFTPLFDANPQPDLFRNVAATERILLQYSLWFNLRLGMSLRCVPGSFGSESESGSDASSPPDSYPLLSPSSNLRSDLAQDPEHDPFVDGTLPRYDNRLFFSTRIRELQQPRYRRLIVGRLHARECVCGEHQDRRGWFAFLESG
ncbi:hypothetical protein BD410DRAFT_460373 [Rickenella mellea]|uniref:Uncharacterized protein n=1 Tax=Rickenella mellea TaxID=50990 RepID=A0A4Y7PTS0_9AGAM|nr:hypothetical protein BD410DRAFT_460373 [Rickenella mellea]